MLNVCRTLVLLIAVSISLAGCENKPVGINADGTLGGDGRLTRAEIHELIRRSWKSFVLGLAMVRSRVSAAKVNGAPEAELLAGQLDALWELHRGAVNYEIVPSISSSADGASYDAEAGTLPLPGSVFKFSQSKIGKNHQNEDLVMLWLHESLHQTLRADDEGGRKDRFTRLGRWLGDYVKSADLGEPSGPGEAGVSAWTENGLLHLSYVDRQGIVSQGSVDLSTRQPSAWSILGLGSAAPAVSNHADATTLYLRDARSRLTQLTKSNAGWGDWKALPGASASAPSVVTTPDNGTLVHYVDSTGNLQELSLRGDARSTRTLRAGFGAKAVSVVHSPFPQGLYFGGFSTNQIKNPITTTDDCPAGGYTKELIYSYSLASGGTSSLYACLAERLEPGSRFLFYGGLIGSVDGSPVPNAISETPYCPSGYRVQELYSGLSYCYLVPRVNDEPLVDLGGFRTVVGSGVPSNFGLPRLDPSNPRCPHEYSDVGQFGSKGVHQPIFECLKPYRRLSFTAYRDVGAASPLASYVATQITTLESNSLWRIVGFFLPWAESWVRSPSAAVARIAATQRGIHEFAALERTLRYRHTAGLLPPEETERTFTLPFRIESNAVVTRASDNKLYVVASDGARLWVGEFATESPLAEPDWFAVAAPATLGFDNLKAQGP